MRAVQIADYKEVLNNNGQFVEGTWRILDEGTKFLDAISTEMYIVGISGMMRKGKSYLMNLLSTVETTNFTFPEKQIDLFELGRTTESKTRGVWAYARPFRKDNGETYSMLILDFEGMYDPSNLRKNPNFNAQIFLLAVLCSSYFIYNTDGCIDKQALDQLNFVANVGEYIKTSDGIGFESHFPDNFAWVLRDFFLESVDDTPNKYLERILMQSSIKTKEERDLNSARQAIKESFPSRELFFLPHPCCPENLNRVNELPFSSLEDKFKTEVTKMVRKVFEDVKLKTIRDSRGNELERMKIKGREFRVFIQSLLQTLNTSKLFCVEDSWTSVSSLITQKAYEKAVESFKSSLSLLVSDTSPIVESDVWTNKVLEFSKNSFDLYIHEAILREDENYGARALKSKLDEVDKELSRVNLQKSEFKTEEIVNNLIIQLCEDINAGKFTNNKEYIDRKNKMFNEIQAMQGKVGPAFHGMQGLMNTQLVHPDELVAKVLELGELEIENQENIRRSLAAIAEQQATEALLREEKKESERKREEWEITQKKLEKAHEEEMAKQRAEMVEKMKKLKEETDQAFERGEQALAEQKQDSQRRLTAAISGLEEKHKEDMNALQLSHQSTINQMQQQTQELSNRLTEVRRQAEESEERLKAEMERKNNQPAAAQGRLVLVWTPMGPRLAVI